MDNRFNIHYIAYKVYGHQTMTPMYGLSSDFYVKAETLPFPFMGPKESRNLFQVCMIYQRWFGNTCTEP